MPITLGYWKATGIAQGMRLLLKYVGEDYKDDLYSVDSDIDCGDWFSVKYKKGLDFPNLPYLIDGDLKITQSSAIFFYLAEKYNLIGDTPVKRCNTVMLQHEVFDLRVLFTRHCYQPKEVYLNNNAGFKSMLTEKIGFFSKYLASKKWLTGEEIMYADFDLYDLLDVVKQFDPQIIQKFPNLQGFMSRFEVLPAIKAYQESDACIKWPIMGPGAAWGRERN